MGRSGRESHHASSVWGLVALSLLLAFIAGALLRVYLWGVCCADDAYSAVVAKNLATGLGYTSTIPAGSLVFVATPFDPYATTGPTLILPTAILVKLFGNSYWVPGLSAVICWSILLLGLGLLARTYNAGAGLALSTLAFLSLNYVIPVYEQAWDILIGEVPAALLLVLGVFLFFQSDTRRFKILAGISFGLAILTKSLSLGAIPAFFLGLASWELLNWHNRTSARLIGLLRSCGWMSAGLLLPPALFEAWKYLALGPALYVQRLGASWQVFFGWGLKMSQPTTFLGLYTARSSILWQDFRVWLPGLFIIPIVIWIVIREKPRLAPLFLVFIWMVIFYSVWWVFFSIGWPRYYFMALLLTTVVMALPFLQRNLPLQVLLPYVLVLVGSSVPFWPHLVDRLRDPGGYGHGRQQTEALLEVSGILERAVAGHEMIVTQQWTTADDLEYIMDTHLNFTNYRDTRAIQDRGFLIAVNTLFWDQGDANFMGLLENCRDKRRISIYLLADCPPNAGE